MKIAGNAMYEAVTMLAKERRDHTCWVRFTVERERERGKPITMYVIDLGLWPEGTPRLAWRRYSDFWALHGKLLETYGASLSSSFEFPGRGLAAKSNEESLEFRRHRFNRLLRMALSTDPLSRALVAWLSDGLMSRGSADEQSALAIWRAVQPTLLGSLSTLFDDQNTTGRLHAALLGSSKKRCSLHRYKADERTFYSLRVECGDSTSYVANQPLKVFRAADQFLCQFSQVADLYASKHLRFPSAKRMSGFGLTDAELDRRASELGDWCQLALLGAWKQLDPDAQLNFLAIFGFDRVVSSDPLPVLQATTGQSSTSLDDVALSSGVNQKIVHAKRHDTDVARHVAVHKSASVKLRNAIVAGNALRTSVSCVRDDEGHPRYETRVTVETTTGTQIKFISKSRPFKSFCNANTYAYAGTVKERLKFPQTYRKSALGVPLTTDELEQRTGMLDTYVSKLFAIRNFCRLPIDAQLSILDSLRFTEEGVATAPKWRRGSRKPSFVEAITTSGDFNEDEGSDDDDDDDVPDAILVTDQPLDNDLRKSYAGELEGILQEHGATRQLLRVIERQASKELPRRRSFSQGDELKSPTGSSRSQTFGKSRSQSLGYIGRELAKQVELRFLLDEIVGLEEFYYSQTFKANWLSMSGSASPPKVAVVARMLGLAEADHKFRGTHVEHHCTSSTSSFNPKWMPPAIATFTFADDLRLDRKKLLLEIHDDTDKLPNAEESSPDVVLGYAVVGDLARLLRKGATSPIECPLIDDENMQTLAKVRGFISVRRVVDVLKSEAHAVLQTCAVFYQRRRRAGTLADVLGHAVGEPRMRLDTVDDCTQGCLVRMMALDSACERVSCCANNSTGARDRRATWTPLGLYVPVDATRPYDEGPISLGNIIDVPVGLNDILPMPPDEFVVEDWHQPRTGQEDPQGFQYAPSLDSQAWTSNCTADDLYRRTTWYRLTTRDPAAEHAFSSSSKRGEGTSSALDAYKLNRRRVNANPSRRELKGHPGARRRRRTDIVHPAANDDPRALGRQRTADVSRMLENQHKDSLTVF